LICVFPVIYSIVTPDPDLGVYVLFWSNIWENFNRYSYSREIPQKIHFKSKFPNSDCLAKRPQVLSFKEVSFVQILRIRGYILWYSIFFISNHSMFSESESPNSVNFIFIPNQATIHPCYSKEYGILQDKRFLS